MRSPHLLHACVFPLNAASGHFSPRPGLRENTETAPDTAVMYPEHGPGPGWGALPWGRESGAGEGRDPPKATAVPMGTLFHRCHPGPQPISVRGAREGHSDACKAQRTQGTNPGAITVLIPGGQQRIALSPAFTARAAVTNPVSLSRNNSGPFQQEPLGNPGARGLCKRVWNMLEPNASSGQRDGASRATTAAPGGDFIFPQDSNSQEFEHSSAYR